ncbi:MAG: hypothetical protein FWC22_07045 [Treponema sp.]|nr:hypothetical protein [Treponema sp.]
MDNERNKVNFISALLKEFSTVFTFMMISFSLVGKIITVYYPEAKQITALFASYNNGLSYAVIFQAAAFSLIMAFIIRFLFSGFFLTKLSIIQRYLLFYLATLIISAVFSMFFKWIPPDNLYAWIAFFLFFSIFFFLSIGLSLLLLKFEDKKYNKLLENYKNKYNI